MSNVSMYSVHVFWLLQYIKYHAGQREYKDDTDGGDGLKVLQV